jgi:hypothetical protein
MPLKECPSSWQWQEVGDQDVTWIVMLASDPKLHPQLNLEVMAPESYANFKLGHDLGVNYENFSNNWFQ